MKHAGGGVSYAVLSDSSSPFDGGGGSTTTLTVSVLVSTP